MQTGEALAPAHEVASYRYMVAALVFGAAGAMIALAAFSAHDYRVGPMVVELEVMPDTSGKTQLGVEPIRSIVQSGFVEAETHLGFLSGRATVIGVVGDAVLDEVAGIVSPTDATKSGPRSLAESIRDQGEDAFRRFGLRVGWLTLAGGGAGGMAIALFGMKARRIFQGALGGVLLVGILGLVAWQTYDIDKFDQLQFRPAGQAAPLESGG